MSILNFYNSALIGFELKLTALNLLKFTRLAQRGLRAPLMFSLVEGHERGQNSTRLRCLAGLIRA